MPRTALAGILFLIGGSTASAQAPADTSKRVLEVGAWYPSLEFGLTANQNATSDNWSGGDRGSIVWGALANAQLENQLRPAVNWLSTLKLAYGQTHRQEVGGGGERFWERPDKSTDLVDLETIWRLTLGAWVDPFVSGRFQSQFQDASDPDGRRLSLNPLQFTESAGIARKFIDEKNRQLLSRTGFALRQSTRRLFVNPAPDDSTVTKTSNDGGLAWITDYKTLVLNDRVSWTSKLTVYQPFFYSGQDELESLSPAELAAGGIDSEVADLSTRLDADWENIFTAPITRILSVNLYLRWVYDAYDNTVLPLLDGGGNLTNPEVLAQAVRKAGQFKETLALGVTYRIP